jgi:hypothetical protein
VPAARRRWCSTLHQCPPVIKHLTASPFQTHRASLQVRGNRDFSRPASGVALHDQLAVLLACPSGGLRSSRRTVAPGLASIVRGPRSTIEYRPNNRA